LVSLRDGPEGFYGTITDFLLFGYFLLLSSFKRFIITLSKDDHNIDFKLVTFVKVWERVHDERSKMLQNQVHGTLENGKPIEIFFK
jgi:hypothetical protein